MNLEATILTSPDAELSLVRDIRLVKLSLIYSDRVTLVSPKFSMVVAVMQMSTLNQAQQFELIKEIAPTINPSFPVDQLDTYLEQVHLIKKKKRKTKQELVALGKFESILRQINKGLQETGETIYRESNFDQIIPLIESGRLEFKHFDIGAGKEEFSKFMLNETIEALKQSSTSYPVFDELISSIAHHYSLENDFSFSQQNPKEIEFGKEVILELPNIDSFSIANIDRLKEELDNELSRFKGAVLGYSKSIQASTYSEESRLEIKKQYDYHIKPELEALRRQIKKNKLVNLIIDEVMSNQAKYITQSMIGIGLCSLFDYEKLLGMTGILGEASYKTFKNRKENMKKIKEHPLFFLNEIREL